MTAQEPMTSHTYIKSLRSNAKKAYATRYWSFLRNGEIGDEPERDGLSFIDANSIRLTLHKIYFGEI